jgi:heavy metal translocating P-type ATPase
MFNLVKSARSLLAVTSITLFLGAFFKYLVVHEKLAAALWILGAVSALIPSIIWFLNELKDKQIGSDVLAIFSITAALATKEFLAASVIGLMLATGRVLESWAEGEADRQLKTLINRIPKNATRISSNGGLEVISLEEISVGDTVLVKSGEVVPIDGELLESGFLDQSALTGEPIPVLLAIGENVLSGTVNAGNNFTMKVTSSYEQSTYSGIVTMVRNSQAKSAKRVKVASAWALKFVPLTLLIAVGAWIVSGEVSRFVAVLVIATPCPLILAVPIALVSGMSRAAKFGSVIKEGASIEKLAAARVILLDKTGTLTHGGPEINKIVTSDGLTEHMALQIAASLDQYSPHIVAKTLVKKATELGLKLVPASDVVESHGKEVTGIVNGDQIRIGTPPEQLPAWADIDYPLLVALHVNNELVAIFGLDDPIRSDSKKTINRLKELGVREVALITGDIESNALKVANELGIESVYSSATPATKLEVVRDRMANNQGTVIAVGDGINDAPALAAADIGVAMGARGVSAASEAADIVIVEDSISHLVSALSISKLAMKRANQSAIGGMALAAIGMAAAALGLTTASEGALIQELIDLAAILWALTTLRGAR